MDPNISKERYLQFQIMQEETEKLLKQIEDLEEQKEELKITIENIKEFEKTQGKRKVLSPLVPGIFVKTEISSFDDLWINVGQGIIVKKKPSDAIKLIEKHTHEIEKIINKINERLIQQESEFLKLERELGEHDV